MATGAVWFKIKQANGIPVTGVVQGSGGVLHTENEGKRYRLHELKQLRNLIRTATAGQKLWAYEPVPGHVEVYPDYTFYGAGKGIPVDLRGATATLKAEGYRNKRGRQHRIIEMSRKLADKEWSKASLIRRGDEPVETAFKAGPSGTIVQRRLGGMSDDEHMMFTDLFHQHLRQKKYQKLAGGKRRHASGTTDAALRELQKALKQ